MANIVNAKVEVLGTRPLFQHRFTPDALPLEKQERTGVAGNDPENWRKTCIVDKNGQLFLDPSYVFASIREGGKGIKRGKGGIYKFIASTLQVTDNKVLIDRFYPGFPCDEIFDAETVDVCSTDPDEPVYIDVRGVVNPSTKARNVRYRLACSPGWKITFNIMWDKTVVSRGEMESCVIEAGRLVGLANGRAIGMGRFEIESFTVAE